MANRNFPNGKAIYTNHTAPVMVDVAITIGAAGAVASISTANSFVTGVTHTGTGLYTIALADKYYSSIMTIGSATSPNSGLSGILAIEAGNAPSTSVSGTSPNVKIKTLDAAGALADPASGATITVLMYLSNSSLG